MAYLLSTPTTALNLNPSNSLIFLNNSSPHFLFKFPPVPLTRKFITSKNITKNGKLHRNLFLSRSTDFNTPTAFVTETDSDYESGQDFDSSDGYSEEEEEPAQAAGIGQPPPPMRRRRRRYRKAYPGESKGITEEMRFVAMKLRNSGKPKSKKKSALNGEENEGEKEDNEEEKKGSGNEDTWQPSIEGYLKYLVDSELVFRTVERIVDESSDVSYVYFRKTGLERSDCIVKDLEWLRSEHGFVIPEASNPGVTYVEYLKKLAENSPPLFLCHFYNIYFSHIAGGQVISKQVSDKLFEGRELEFYKWDGDARELLRGVRDKLNALGEHWSRDEKNKCLREATKAFRFLGQIVRLIIL